VPSWPQYYFKGKLEEPIEVYPGVDINAASVGRCRLTLSNPR
jgi:hypothetical protein